MAFFTIIIPTYNRKKQLPRAVDSVLCQSFSDYELIVVDDGSTDGTESLFQSQGSNIKYIWQKNSGVSAARNRGIEESTGEHIAFLDSDDTWHKEKLMRHHEFIANNSNIKIHQTNDIWIRNGRRVNPAKKHIKKEGEIFAPSLKLCMISPSSVVMSRELFEKYGIFDPELPACEDYDLWLRITPFEEIGLIEESLITRYAGHGDQLSQKYEAMDRFRLYALLKLKENSSHGLGEEKNKLLDETIETKIHILLTGARKRNNERLESLLLNISDRLPSCRRKDYRNLLS